MDELVACVVSGDVKGVQRLLMTQKIELNYSVNGKSNFLLHICCRLKTRAHELIAASLLSVGVDPNIINSKGNTPLHLACTAATDTEGEELSLALVRLLLGYSAYTCAINHNGDTPLTLACSWSESSRTMVAIVRMLLDAGADPSHVASHDGRTALHWACARLTRRKLVRKILRGIDRAAENDHVPSRGQRWLDVRDGSGCTALMHAVTACTVTPGGTDEVCHAVSTCSLPLL